MFVVGEAILDIVARGGDTSEAVGGSALNVACGLARLGHDVTFAGWWADDPAGRMIDARLAAAGVRVAAGSRGAEHSSIARASIGADGSARYDFDVTNRFGPLTPDPGHVHLGSIGGHMPPGSDSVVELAARWRDHGTVSYDPNVREALVRPREQVRAEAEWFVARADVVKASDEDLRWLYPELTTAAAVELWAQAGPAVVVATRGPAGALVRLRGASEAHEVPAPQVRVADTVGAGDSCMAGLLSGLADAGLIGTADARKRLDAARWDDVRPAVERGIACAAVTVTKAGSYSPARGEVG